MFVIKAGTHKMLVRISNRGDPDQTALFVYAFVGKQLVFKILEHQLYTNFAKACQFK